MRPRPEPEQPFSEPWHAELFATTHALAAAGAFQWSEWSEAFIAALQRADSAGAPKDGSAYYEVWLSAFEDFLIRRGLAEGKELGALRQAWTEAYLKTPHGSPAELPRD
ncbi:MAG: nitrile hydratase accessory protein [Kiloniellales bacterium]|nr:nitrile hydratase accessory protein [Kiloniellales bacterium]